MRTMFGGTLKLVLICSIVWFKCVCSASSPGAASSVFSSRGQNNKIPRPSDFQNKDNSFISDEWYEMSLNSNNSSRPIPDEQMLIARLLRNYDPAARPVYNASSTVVVRFGFLLIQICDMDERNQILTTNVWLEQEWFDERLVWNSSEFNNLDKIRLPCNRIWLPDIVLYNSADDYTEGYMQSKAMVKPNGEVFWPPPAKLRSSCKIDVTFFPFDDQVCHLKFGSWTYSGLQVDLVNKSNTTDLTNYIKSGEWELKYVTVERNVQYYPCCPDEPYPDVIFYIHIRRRILYYLFNIILPCVWLSILSLIGFWLPPDSGEKITLGITVLLAFSVFMLLIAENIPATSEMVPLIGIYLTVVMSLTSMSIILTVLVLQLHHAGQFAPTLSRPVYEFMTRKLAVVVFMTSTVKRYEDTNKEMKRKYELSRTSLDNSKAKSNQVLKNCDQKLNLLKDNLVCDDDGDKSKPSARSRVSHYVCCCGGSDDSLNLPSPKCEPTINYFYPHNGKVQKDSTHISHINEKTASNETADNEKIRNSIVINDIKYYSCSKVFKNIDRDESQISMLKKGSLQSEILLNKNLSGAGQTESNQSSSSPLASFNIYKVSNSVTSSPARYNHMTGHLLPPTLKQRNTSPFMCTHNNNNINLSINNTTNNAKCSRTGSGKLKAHSSSHASSKNRELIESLEIFSKNLKEYLAKQEQDAYRSNVQNEWKLVALIVDRLLFWIFTFLTIISSIILLIIVPILKNKDLIKQTHN